MRTSFKAWVGLIGVPIASLTAQRIMLSYVKNPKKVTHILSNRSLQGDLICCKCLRHSCRRMAAPYVRTGHRYLLLLCFCSLQLCTVSTVGFLVSNSTFKCLVMRYSDQQGQVYFDDFILCAVRLKTMFGRSTLSFSPSVFM